MKNKTASAQRLKIQLIMKWTGLTAAALLVSMFIFSASALMQTFEMVWNGKAKQQAELISPQAARPDILWMRGGHTSAIWDTSYAPNANLLATISQTSVKIWRASDNVLMKTIPNTASHTSNTRCLSFSKDGSLLAVCGTNAQNFATVELYRISDGTLLQTFTDDTAGYLYTGVDISPDKSFIAVASQNTPHGFLWRVSDGNVMLKYGDGVQGTLKDYGKGDVAFSPDGTLLALGPILINVADRSIVRTLSQAFGRSTNFSPNGQYLAVGGVVFDVASGATIAIRENNVVVTNAFSTDSSLVAISSTNNPELINIHRLSNFSSNTPPISQINDTTNLHQSLSFISDENLITSSYYVKKWNASTGAFINGFDDHPNGTVTNLAYSTDGQSVFIAAATSFENYGNSSSIIKRSVLNGSLSTVSFPQSKGLNIYQMGLTPDNQRLVTIDDSNNHHYVKIWNAGDGSLIRNTDFSNNGSLTLAVSPDNQSYVLSGYGNGAGGATQYSINDGSVIKVINSNNDCNEKTLAISPDGQTLATMRYFNCSGEGGLVFYRMSDGAVIRRIGNPGPTGSLRSGAFSPDGQTFAATVEYNPADNPKSICLFRISDGAIIRNFDGNQATADQVAFSPDGQTIASTSLDHTVRFWRVSDGTLLQTFDTETYFKGSGGFAAYSPIKFSPDGSRFAYGRADATVVMAGNPLASVTASGSNVSVTSGGVDLTFSGVTSPGVTSVALVQTGSISALPANFQIGSFGAAYQIGTTASFSGSILVKFIAPQNIDQTTFNSLRVLHYENGVWIDSTVLAPNSPAPDYATRSIYARVTSLSPFAVAQFTPPAPSTIDVSLLGTLPSTALKNTTLTQPIFVGDTTGKSIISYDFRVTYDPAVLALQQTPFDKTGTLSSGFEVNVNSSTPGLLIVSGFGSSALSGMGNLLNLKFTATGSTSACSALNFTAFQFNEGNPASTTANGQACVISGTVSGAVTYALSAQQTFVSNVTLAAVGSVNRNATTDANGSYSLNGLGSGAYTVTPSKTGEDNGAVSAFDASLIAQHVIGLTVLNAAKQTAADVSGDGTISSFDAGLIARYAVGLPDTAQAGAWKFNPVSRNYLNTDTDQTNQDYSAILMGDVTGNWTAVSSRPAFESFADDAATELDDSRSVKVGFGKSSFINRGELTIPVIVSDLTNKGIYSFEFDLEFDAEILQSEQTTDVTKLLEISESLSKQFSFAVNALEPGKLRVSAYGVNALEGEGVLMNLKLKVASKRAASGELKWTRFRFNEGEQQVRLTNGRVTGNDKPDRRGKSSRDLSTDIREN